MEKNQQPLDPSSSRIFQDLVVHSKLHPELVLRRCDYATAELAILWQQNISQGKENTLQFYQETELYLYDLTKYQLVLEHQGIIRKMIQQMKALGIKKALEFGGGIGEFSLCCAEEGISITYHDVEGVIKTYALWRFQKHGQLSRIQHLLNNPLDQEWDLVNVMDVLEHLENPKPVILSLQKYAKYIFCNPEEIKYNHFYPQHLSTFDLTPFFERREGYLWKNKTKKS